MAAAVFTQLLEVDSSHRVELASALATRAQLLLEDRRNLAGRDTAIAAVEHYQRIPQLGFDSIDQCGKASVTSGRAADLGEGLEAPMSKSSSASNNWTMHNGRICSAP